MHKHNFFTPLKNRAFVTFHAAHLQTQRTNLLQLFRFYDRPGYNVQIVTAGFLIPAAPRPVLDRVSQNFPSSLSKNTTPFSNLFHNFNFYGVAEEYFFFCEA